MAVWNICSKEEILCGVGTKQVVLCSGYNASNPGIYIKGF